MKKMIYFFMATLLCVVMISCGGNQKAGQLERERDSIASINTSSARLDSSRPDFYT